MNNTKKPGIQIGAKVGWITTSFQMFNAIQPPVIYDTVEWSGRACDLPTTLCFFRDIINKDYNRTNLHTPRRITIGDHGVIGSVTFGLEKSIGIIPKVRLWVNNTVVTGPPYEVIVSHETGEVVWLCETNGEIKLTCDHDIGGEMIFPETESTAFVSILARCIIVMQEYWRLG